MILFLYKYVSDLVLWIVLSFLDPKLFFCLWVYSEFSGLLSSALYNSSQAQQPPCFAFNFVWLFFLQFEGSAIFSRLVGGLLCWVFSCFFILGLFCLFFLVRICTEFPVVVVVRKKVISFSPCLVLFVSE